MTATRTRREAHEHYAATHGLATASWSALGTGAQVVVTDPTCLPAARGAVERVLHDIDLAASRFRDDSELQRLNTSGGGWVEVSPLLARALQVALDAAEWTDGLVDPTIGGALIAHGYDVTFSAVASDDAALPMTVAVVPGWRHVELQAERSQPRVRVPAGALLDLGATAKAFAADLAADAAADVTSCGVLINLGGDISVAGESPAAGWPITVTDIADPSLPAEGPGQTVVVRDGGLATSSTRARRWRRGGIELHHLIDPRSAAPAVTPWRTVSVTAATCTLANTASTAAIILGEPAVRWLEERGMHARLVRADGSVAYVGEWPREQPS